MGTGKIELDEGELQKWVNEIANLKLDFLKFKYWAEGEILSLNTEVAFFQKAQPPTKEMKDKDFEQWLTHEETCLKVSKELDDWCENDVFVDELYRRYRQLEKELADWKTREQHD